MTPHPLLAVLLDAAAGRFPPVDGLECATAFTGHAVVSTALPAAELDLLLVAPGAGGDHGGTAADAVPLRLDLESHDRVRRARSLRAFLACGFVPVGSEVLLRPARADA